MLTSDNVGEIVELVEKHGKSCCDGRDGTNCLSVPDIYS